MSRVKETDHFVIAPDSEIWLCGWGGCDVSGLDMLFRKMGYTKVRTLADEKSLLQELTSCIPALLVLDIHTNQEQGTPFIKDLKSASEYPNLALLPVISDRDSAAQRESLSAYGIFDCVAFPVRASDLGAAVSKTLSAFSRSSVEPLISNARKAFAASAWDQTEAYYQKARQSGIGIRTEVGLAQVSLKQEQPEKALVYAQNAVNLDSSNFPAALAVYETKIRLAKDTETLPSPEAYALLCQQAQSPERLLALLRAFSSQPALLRLAFETDRGRFLPHPRCVVEYGKALLALEQFELALSVLKRCKTSHKPSFELHNLLGVLHKRMGTLDLAQQEYIAALKLCPGDIRVLFNLGLCFEERQLLSDARKAYQQCLDISPTFAKARERLAKLGGENP